MSAPMNDARGARAAGGTRRVPPAALRGDDARGRTAGDLRRARHATKFPTAAGISWSMMRWRDACVSEPADDGGGEVLRYPQGRRPRPPAACSTTHHAGRDQACCCRIWLTRRRQRPIISGVRSRHAVERRGRRRSAPVCSRGPHANALLRGTLDAPAAAVAAGYPRRAPRARRRKNTSPAKAKN